MIAQKMLDSAKDCVKVEGRCDQCPQDAGNECWGTLMRWEVAAVVVAALEAADAALMDPTPTPEK